MYSSLLFLIASVLLAELPTHRPKDRSGASAPYKLLIQKPCFETKSSVTNSGLALATSQRYPLTGDQWFSRPWKWAREETAPDERAGRRRCNETKIPSPERGLKGSLMKSILSIPGSLSEYPPPQGGNTFWESETIHLLCISLQSFSRKYLQ